MSLLLKLVPGYIPLLIAAIEIRTRSCFNWRVNGARWILLWNNSLQKIWNRRESIGFLSWAG